MSAGISVGRGRQPDGALLAPACDPGVDVLQNDRHNFGADGDPGAVSCPTAAQVFVEDRAVDEVLEF
jgi:hypothetical protein